MYRYLVFGQACSIVHLLEQSARPGAILSSIEAAGALPTNGWLCTISSVQPSSSTSQYQEIQICEPSLDKDNIRLMCGNASAQRILFEKIQGPASRTIENAEVKNIEDNKNYNNKLLIEEETASIQEFQVKDVCTSSSIASLDNLQHVFMDSETASGYNYTSNSICRIAQHSSDISFALTAHVGSQGKPGILSHRVSLESDGQLQV